MPIAKYKPIVKYKEGGNISSSESRNSGGHVPDSSRAGIKNMIRERELEIVELRRALDRENEMRSGERPAPSGPNRPYAATKNVADYAKGGKVTARKRTRR